MHIAVWLMFTILALVCFGVVGLLQKLSTDRVSAESALIWLIVGFLLLQPFLYPGRSLTQYFAAQYRIRLRGRRPKCPGSWAILAAMKSGGKASVVVPFTAVYPSIVCLVAPLLLHERLSTAQGFGIVCGLGAIFLLAS